MLSEVLSGGLFDALSDVLSGPLFVVLYVVLLEFMFGGLALAPAAFLGEPPT